jgi:diguanylate cyclase (GGDEF)-like protein
MINDSYGHMFGDKLLIAAAHRLVNSPAPGRDVRIDDRFTIARLGGDEFAIILGDLREPTDAEVVANRLMGAGDCLLSSMKRKSLRRRTSASR